MAVTPGQTLSHYRLVEKIGEGGMGVVWKADDTVLGRHVAIKVLPPDVAREEKRRQMFFDEARLASSVNEPHIVQVYEFGQEGDLDFIVMEYVEGKPLKEMLHGKPLPPETVAAIGQQVARALSKAHKKGLIHRDLKPANILITPDGDAKVVDFGLAALFTPHDSTIASADSTQSIVDGPVAQQRAVVGTIPYMSPEQVRGEKLDGRSDIFSLGSVLYEMTTGQRAFLGVSHQDVLRAILKGRPTPVHDILQSVPVDLDKIISKTLSPRPGNRYQHAEDLEVDLKHLLRELESGASPSFRVPSIAVLPFADMSPGKDQEYFCEGIAEELIGGLTKLEGLQVAARTSAFQFRGKGHDLREIGERLQVQTILEGSVRKAGNRIRITAQLVNIADGFHLWSDRFDRDLDDIFGIQDEISLAIVESLRIRLLGGEKERLVKRHTRDPEAHSLYLKGRYFWNRPYEVGLKKSLDHFQRAIDKDPHYALPYVGIADSYSLLGWFGFLPPKEAFTRSKEAATRALALDDSLGEAHTSLAWTHMAWDWDWDAAEREFQRAIELAPEYATAHRWYGLFLTVMKRFPEAIAEVRRAQELDPLSVIISAAAGGQLYLARRYDDAVVELKRALEMDPTFVFAFGWLSLCLFAKGDHKGAREAIRQATELGPVMIYTLGCLGLIQGMTGQKEEARRTLERLDSISRQRYASPLAYAFVYAGLRELDRALDELDKAYAIREPMLICSNIVPFFDDLRAERRFVDLMKKIRLPTD